MITCHMHTICFAIFINRGGEWGNKLQMGVIRNIHNLYHRSVFADTPSFFVPCVSHQRLFIKKAIIL